MVDTMPWEDFAAQPAPVQETGPWMDFQQAPQAEPNSPLATAAKGFAQGITLNSADEIDAGLTAAKRALVNGGDFSKEYADKLAYNRQSDAQDTAANPVSNFAGNVAGGVALAPLLPEINATSLGGKVLQSATQGADMGAAYGFGGAEGDISDRVHNAAQGAVVGGVTGGAVPVVANGISKALGTGAQQFTAAEAKGMANQAYKKADELGGMLSPQVTNTFIADASKSLKPQTEAGLLVAGKSAATDLTDRLTGLVDKPLSLQSAQEVDEELGNLISKEYGITGLSKDGKKMLDLQTAFRKSLNDATPENGGILGNKDGFSAWQEGKKLWSKAAQLRDVETIINKAQLADQPANAIRSGFRTLANNPARLRSYDPEIRGLIRNAAKHGVVGNLLRVAGSRLLPIVAGGGGFVAGGPIGAGVSLAGAEGLSYGARKAGQTLATSKANAISQAISNKIAPAAAETASGLLRPVVAGAAGAVSPRPILTVPNQQSQPQTTPAPVPISSTPTAHTVISSEEGTKPTAYVDSTGHKTVGTGFNLDQPTARAIWAKAGVPEDFDAVYSGQQALSPESDAKIFGVTSSAAQKAVSKMVPGYDQLGDNQKAALTSLAYQLGGKGLSKFKALDYLKDGNSKAVENSILGTLMAKQSPARARREALMLAYDMSHEDADRQLVAQGRIKPNERKYL